jgi:putative nucleotidyltransferase with HDIG domain
MISEKRWNVFKLYLSIEEHLLTDEKPSIYLNEICFEEEFSKHPFVLIKRLKEVGQSPKYHAEGNVWNHTMMVVDEAAKVRDRSSDERVFMWASLLHDVGKAVTTKVRKGRITAYGHDVAGERLAKEFLSCFTDDLAFIGNVALLVKYHMHILYVLKDLPFKDMEGMKRDVDVFDVALLGFCDRLGRKGSDLEAEKTNMKNFLKMSGV